MSSSFTSYLKWRRFNVCCRTYYENYQDIPSLINHLECTDIFFIPFLSWTFIYLSRITLPELVVGEAHVSWRLTPCGSSLPALQPGGSENLSNKFGLVPCTFRTSVGVAFKATRQVRANSAWYYQQSVSLLFFVSWKTGPWGCAVRSAQTIRIRLKNYSNNILFRTWTTLQICHSQ
jgi:hypothetical protein